MLVYSGRGIGDVYYQLIRDLTLHGRKVTVRGNACLEFTEPVTLEYTQPGYCWMRIPNRKWNPFLALAEIVWILSGNGNVNWISHFSSKMKDFQDGDNPNFHGSYGLRLRRWRSETGSYRHIDQVEWMVKKLREQPESRQAVMSLWDPERDNILQSKDYPCNNWVGYTLRDGVLDQTVVIRSNDLVWGTPINAVQFTHIQAYIAGCLGVRMGKLTYVINNLHYYIDQYKPTLSNLIDQAHTGRPIEAEKILTFDTFNEKQFHALSEFVNLSLETWSEEKEDEVPDVLLLMNKEFTNSMGRYLLAIGNALYTFSLIKSTKENVIFSTAFTSMISGEFEALGQPLVDLIIDFYKDSKNEFAKKVISEIRRKEDVSVRA